jgi:hypothetical protein
VELGPEDLGVAVLQRIEEACVPGVDQLGDVDDEDARGDDDGEQGTRNPAFLGVEGDPAPKLEGLPLLGEPVGAGEVPELARERAGGGDAGQEAVDHADGSRRRLGFSTRTGRFRLQRRTRAGIEGYASAFLFRDGAA